MNFTYDEIKEAHDALIEGWGEDGKRVIEAIFNEIVCHILELLYVHL